MHWPLMLLAEFCHARYLSNEILRNVGQYQNYNQLRQKKKKKKKKNLVNLTQDGKLVAKIET